MNWWESLIRMRRNVCPQPDVGCFDSGFRVFTCPQGHTTTILEVMPQGLPPVDRLKRRFDHTNEARTCQTCGGTLRTSRIEMGSWLPQARRELVIRIGSTGVDSLVLLSPDGTAEEVGETHPLLAEMPKASAVRAALGRFDDDPRENLRSAVRQYPDYPPAVKALARHEKARGDLEAALGHAQRAVDLQLDDAEAHFILGDILDETPQQEAALAAYDCATALDPHLLQAHVQRGILLRRMGRSDEARQSYERALENDAHHPLALYNLAVLQHSTADASGLIETLARVRPSSLEADTSLKTRFFIICCEAAEKCAEADAWLEAAHYFQLATLFVDHPKTRYNLALCYGNCGLWTEAVPVLKQLGDFKDARARLRHAEQSIADMGGRSEPIAALSEEIITYDDASGQPRRMLGFVVKIATQTRMIESEVDCLSLAREKDLVKLLIAKGHNLRVARGERGRPIVFFLERPPADDFLRFACATRWRTPGGVVVESAVAPLFVNDVVITRPSDAVVDLPRVPALELESGDLFYPEAYSGYD